MPKKIEKAFWKVKKKRVSEKTKEIEKLKISRSKKKKKFSTYILQERK